MDRTIVATEKNYRVDVPEDVAASFLEDYEALANLPVTRQIQADFKAEDFPDKDGKPSKDNAAKAARLYARQGRSWAEDNGLKFVRKGDIKAQPTRVTYRIYAPKAVEADDE